MACLIRLSRKSNVPAVFYLVVDSILWVVFFVSTLVDRPWAALACVTPGKFVHGFLKWLSEPAALLFQSLSTSFFSRMYLQSQGT